VLQTEIEETGSESISQHQQNRAFTDLEAAARQFGIDQPAARASWLDLNWDSPDPQGPARRYGMHALPPPRRRSAATGRIVSTSTSCAGRTLIYDAPNGAVRAGPWWVAECRQMAHHLDPPPRRPAESGGVRCAVGGRRTSGCQGSWELGCGRHACRLCIVVRFFATDVEVENDGSESEHKKPNALVLFVPRAKKSSSNQ